jgi:hypothetical protein
MSAILSLALSDGVDRVEVRFAPIVLKKSANWLPARGRRAGVCPVQMDIGAGGGISFASFLRF